jgi:hypothetical protein
MTTTQQSTTTTTFRMSQYQTTELRVGKFHNSKITIIVIIVGQQ